MVTRFTPRTPARRVAASLERLLARPWVRVALFIGVFLAVWLWDIPVAHARL